MAWQNCRNDGKYTQFYCVFFGWNLKLRVCMTFDYNGFYDTKGKEGVRRLHVSLDCHLVAFKVREKLRLDSKLCIFFNL